MVFTLRRRLGALRPSLCPREGNGKAISLWFVPGKYNGNAVECLVRNASPFLIVMWFLLEYDTSPLTPLLGHVMVKVIQSGNIKRGMDNTFKILVSWSKACTS